MIPRMVVAELGHRPLSALLGAVAVGAAVAAGLLVVLLARAAENETRVIQRDIGLNVLVLPGATDVDRYWSLGYSEHTMPAENLARLEEQEVANRLVPMLKRRVEWRGARAMLVGIGSEIFAGGQRKKPVFGRALEPGTVVVGGHLARELGVAVGDEVDLLGTGFLVASTLAPTGTDEDVRVYLDLADAQALLALEGRINEIQAIECHCADDSADPLAVLRAELEPLLPDTVILRRREAADARRRQRRLAERALLWSTPAVLALAGLLVASLAVLNVRERRPEVGILRTLGYGSAAVSGLFLGRAIAVGAAGGLAGTGLAWLAAELVGPRLFEHARVVLAPTGAEAAGACLAAALFAAAASLVSVVLALRVEPAEVLGDD